MSRTRPGARITCPVHARCKVVKLAGTTPVEYGSMVSRWLSCSPPRGDYTRPAAVCRALEDFIQRLQEPHGACSCPGDVGRATVTGTLQGKRLHLSFDNCTGCGLGAGGAHDVSTIALGLT